MVNYFCVTFSKAVPIAFVLLASSSDLWPDVPQSAFGPDAVHSQTGRWVRSAGTGLTAPTAFSPSVSHAPDKGCQLNWREGRKLLPGRSPEGIPCKILVLLVPASGTLCFLTTLLAKSCCKFSNNIPWNVVLVGLS